MNTNQSMQDVIVIGAGQAGLACGWHLQRLGLGFLILDGQTRPGGNWRNYYDSLKLFSPAAYSSLPGLPFPSGLDDPAWVAGVAACSDAFGAEFARATCGAGDDAVDCDA